MGDLDRQAFRQETRRICSEIHEIAFNQFLHETQWYGVNFDSKMQGSGLRPIQNSKNKLGLLVSTSMERARFELLNENNGPDENPRSTRTQIN